MTANAPEDRRVVRSALQNHKMASRAYNQEVQYLQHDSNYLSKARIWFLSHWTPSLPIPTDNVVRWVVVKSSALEQVVAIHPGLTELWTGLVSRQAKVRSRATNHPGNWLDVRCRWPLALSTIQLIVRFSSVHYDRWRHHLSPPSQFWHETESGGKFSPVPCNRDSSHKTFGPTD
ncbi:hypothetical protein TNCV_807301 [Trichonephila clavipes]|nr:hypothetical protein TNCV_807301 [Trichonephila clavipes]